MSDSPLLTIFTPTYNRAHTLHRVHDSLNLQTVRSFEWLVIDDGSTDGTEDIITNWARSADFPIRYIRQRHAGKHVAHNRALKEARGRFFACLDSDDALPQDSLEQLVNLWETIPVHERVNFYSVGGLCRDQHGGIVGSRFPAEPYDADLREMIFVDGVRGEKWILALTDIMRRYPFPEISETDFIPEGLVWFDVAKNFKTRWTNHVVRTYYVDDPQTGGTLSKRTRLDENALGRWHYYAWFLDNNIEYFARSRVPFLKAAIMLPIVGCMARKTLRQTLANVKSRCAKVLVVAALPVSVTVYIVEALRSLITLRTTKTRFEPN
jgi:glycosyltransferase involved in cell wall biosynthesis